MSNLITPQNKSANSIRQKIAEANSEAIMIQGYDDCIVGVSINDQVIYDVDSIIKKLMGIDHDMNHESAVEWFEFNILGRFSNQVNEPIFVSFNYTYDF
jgi:hypothetical protein